MNKQNFQILVVDDDEAVRESLCKLLEDEGYEVVPAANGLEAVEIFRSGLNEIDLLLVDLNMPMKNGWVTLNQLREINPSLPVFVLTGLSHQSELAEAAGVSALVEKPVDVPGFLELIKRKLVKPAGWQTGSAVEPQFEFHHLSAVCISYKRWMEQAVVPYNHWGLNE